MKMRRLFAMVAFFLVAFGATCMIMVSAQEGGPALYLGEIVQQTIPGIRSEGMVDMYLAAVNHPFKEAILEAVHEVDHRHFVSYIRWVRDRDEAQARLSELRDALIKVREAIQQQEKEATQDFSSQSTQV